MSAVVRFLAAEDEPPEAHVRRREHSESYDEIRRELVAHPGVWAVIAECAWAVELDGVWQRDGDSYRALARIASGVRRPRPFGRADLVIETRLRTDHEANRVRAYARALVVEVEE